MLPDTSKATNQVNSILIQCATFKKLLDSFGEQPPRALEFRGRITEIEELIQTSSARAIELLDGLRQDLGTADDGQGGRILDRLRVDRFFDGGE